ncbi:TPA: hypothetical protein ACYHPH_003374 [Vibrio cholerae]
MVEVRREEAKSRDLEREAKLAAIAKQIQAEGLDINEVMSALSSYANSNKQKIEEGKA